MASAAHDEAPPVRRALRVGSADDPAEREADRVADVVMRALRSTGPGDSFSVTDPGSRVRPAAPVPSTGVARSTAPSAAHHDRGKVRRSTSGVIGREGGVLDGHGTRLVERAAGGGGSVLPGGVQRRMEGAFGADFSAVRVHHGTAAHEASERLSAAAFTTGNDIFFGRDQYRPGTNDGQRLLAHELSHVVQGAGLTTAHRYVRRVLKYGNDPQAMIQNTDKDLLYGINGPRGTTKSRLSPAQKDTIRTIDDYNRAIGINGIIKANTAAMGLYDVRTELRTAAAWGLPLDAALNTPTNAPSIQLWINYLRQHAAKIGLEDLGEKGGFLKSAKIDKKGRFKKNRAESQASDPKSDRLTSSDTRKFLSPANTTVDATNIYNAMSAAKQTALNKWVYRAFFRRTSKLGQDFTVKVLGGTIHFNTVADPDFQPLLGPNWQDRGLETMEQSGANGKNRAITVSELRHMKKLQQQYPGQFNVYGDF